MGSNLSWVCRILTIASLVWGGSAAVGQTAGPERIKFDGDYRLSGPSSATSLQLSLEDEDVEKQIREYRQALLPLGRREKDAIGFAYAINGRFNSADIYGDSGLFQKLWPKLMEAAACEALSMRHGGQSHPAAEPKDIKNQIVDALGSPKRKESSSRSTRRLAGETKKNYSFETKDASDQTIHLNIIAK